MGRPPKVAPARVSAQSSAPASAQPVEIQPGDDALGVAAFLVRNGADDVYAYVRRRNGDVWEFVAKLPAAELDETVLQREYGGGTYEIRVQRPNGQFVGQPLRVAVAGPPKLPAMAQAPPAMPSPADTGMQMLVETMKLQTGLLSALMQSAAKPPTITEMLTALSPLLDARGKSAPSGELDSFLKGVQFRSEMGDPETPPPDAMTTAIEKLALPLLEAAKAQRDKPPMVLRPALPSSLPPKPMPHWIDGFRAYMPLLVSAALNNRDATEIAGPLLVLLPENVFDVIVHEAAHDANFVSKAVDAVIARVPRMESYRAWLTTLATSLQTEVAHMAAEQSDETSAGAGNAE